jgi:hypothetical protein
MAKLQAAYSELELGYAALALECIMERSRQEPPLSGAVPDIVDLA